MGTFEYSYQECLACANCKDYHKFYGNYTIICEVIYNGVTNELEFSEYKGCPTFKSKESAKKKVKRSQAIIQPRNSIPMLTYSLFKNIQEVEHHYSDAKILQFPAGLTIEVDE